MNDLMVLYTLPNMAKSNCISLSILSTRYTPLERPILFYGKMGGLFVEVPLFSVWSKVAGCVMCLST